MGMLYRHLYNDYGEGDRYTKIDSMTILNIEKVLMFLKRWATKRLKY